MKIKYLFAVIFLIFPLNCIYGETFPIGLYSVPAKYFSEVKSWGFNTLVVRGGREDVEAADSVGLSLILSLPYDDEKKLKKTIQEYKKHSNILAWYPIDEPDIYKKSVSTVKSVYQLFKRLDPGKPVYLTVYNPVYYKTFFPYCDILSPDPYPIQSDVVEEARLENVYQSIRSSKELAGGRPVYAVLQSFAGLPYWKRHPTPSELRTMTYEALIAGADGIIYYSFSSGEPYKMPDGTNHWYLKSEKKLLSALKEVISEIKGFISDIEKGGKHREFLISFSKRIPAFFLETEDKYILLSANPYHKKVSFSLDIPGRYDESSVKMIRGTPPAFTKNSKIRFTLPYAGSIYCYILK